MRKKLVSYALRASLVGACLVFVFWGIDLNKMVGYYGDYSLWRILGLEALTFATFLLPAARLSYLTDHKASIWTGYQGFILAMGFNNIFPAKLGELLKVSFFRIKLTIPFSRGMGIVFWERFFDLNAVLALGLITALLMGKSLVLIPLVTVVGAFWIFLAINNYIPALSGKLLGLIPFKSLREFGAEVLDHLQERFDPRFFLGLSIYTAVVWSAYLFMTGLTLWWIAGLTLTIPQTITVFVVASLGASLPSSPGGLGVYEAAVVLSLGWFGIPKEEAVAVGFAMHGLQMLPMIAGAMLVLFGSGLDRGELMKMRGGRRAPQTTDPA